jgi:uncharacterized protein YaiE (UPF0345 family)
LFVLEATVEELFVVKAGTEERLPSKSEFEKQVAEALAKIIKSGGFPRI